MNPSPASSPQAAPAKKRLVLADPHAAMRGMIRRLIASEPEFEIVGEAATGTKALRLCRQVGPDVLVLELALEGVTGADLIAEVRRHGLSTRALIFTGTRHPGLLTAALEARPDGFADKEETFTSFHIALRCVAQGGRYQCPLLSTIDLPPAAGSPVDRLTSRQRAVLKMVAEGKPTKQIASALGLSEKTIEHERTEISKTLQTRDVARLALAAARLGLVE